MVNAKDRFQEAKDSAKDLAKTWQKHSPSEKTCDIWQKWQTPKEACNFFESIERFSEPVQLRPSKPGFLPRTLSGLKLPNKHPIPSILTLPQPMIPVGKTWTEFLSPTDPRI
jgi:hypothetical protein